MFLVVSYDIVDDKRRNRMANLLKDYGHRVQYSVFECNLDKRYMEQMTEEALNYIDENEDSLRIYYLCDECKRKIKAYGKRKMTESEELIVI